MPSWIKQLQGLRQDGKIVPVRLALFAEMVKGKPWTPATLREIGGTEGVGVTFLEETLWLSPGKSQASASPEGSSGGSESPAARDRHRHQGADEITSRVARSLGIREPPQGLR